MGCPSKHFTCPSCDLDFDQASHAAPVKWVSLCHATNIELQISTFARALKAGITCAVVLTGIAAKEEWKENFQDELVNDPSDLQDELVNDPSDLVARRKPKGGAQK